MKPAALFLFLCFFQAIPASAQGGAAEPKISIFEALMRDDTLNLSLSTDLGKLTKSKRETAAYQEASVAYIDRSGRHVQKAVKVKARGKMRFETCRIPLIKLKFPDSELDKEGLEDFSGIKMVVLCEKGDQYEQFVLREYIAYKIYNLLTDNSFRVQLVKITMNDTQNKMKPVESFAILLESEDEVAARLGGELVMPKILSPKGVSAADFDLMCVFQYMIGNTDWTTYNHHNTRSFKAADRDLPICVAYDFDYAGLVNAPYAVPSEGLPIKSVQERIFRGLCRAEGEYEKTFKVFSDKKAEIMALCENFPYFSKNSRSYVIDYLEDFYRILENPKKAKSEITDRCDMYFKMKN
jgi:hypothetical protein